MTDFSCLEEAYMSGISGDNIKIDMTVEDIYGDKYDYSLAEYKNNKTNLLI